MRTLLALALVVPAHARLRCAPLPSAAVRPLLIGPRYPRASAWPRTRSATPASAVATMRGKAPSEEADAGDDKPKGAEKKPPRFTRQQLFNSFIAFALSALFIRDLAFVARPVQVPTIAYSQLVSSLKEGGVKRAVFSQSDREVVVQLSDQEHRRADIFPAVQPELVRLLTERGVEFAVAPAPKPSILLSLFLSVVNVAIPLIALTFIFGGRMLGAGSPGGGPGGPGGGPLGLLSSLGRTKAEMQLEPNTGVTFADVAGCDASKLELREVVEFLKTPGKFAAVGARAPRGVLLEGPPGTGKTLLARAVAGEAAVPFISASGSEFVEMFVGVGASRIRDLFDRAKKSAPCIVFIDEIDAIGRSRGGGNSGLGGGNDEREQTLNQILTEMDGFEKAVGVVVLAATNRADVLDSALLRPGRFDRRVPVELPDRAGRLAILRVHARDKPLEPAVDLESVSQRTTGFSGAGLANLLNEAAIVTARRNKTAVGMPEIEYALDRLTVGLEQRTGMASEARKRLVAFHEAGHAIMGALTPCFDAIGKVTIVPRSNGAGGFTLFVPSDEQQDSGLYSRKYMESQLAVALGGRVAEELVFGRDEVTTGASSDLQRVAEVARKMVTQWGFATETLGSTAWESPYGSTFNMPRMASEATQQRIDAEVERIVRKAYDHCSKTLTSNSVLLNKLAELLVEHETIGSDELTTLVQRYAVPFKPA